MDVEKLRRMSDLELGTWLVKSIDVSSLATVLVDILVVVIVFGQIAKRAGFSRWWSLGLFVPGLGSVLPVLFAIVPWPVERRSTRATTKPKRRRS